MIINAHPLLLLVEKHTWCITPLIASEGINPQFKMLMEPANEIKESSSVTEDLHS